MWKRIWKIQIRDESELWFFKLVTVPLILFIQKVEDVFVEPFRYYMLSTLRVLTHTVK